MRNVRFYAKPLFFLTFIEKKTNTRENGTSLAFYQITQKKYFVKKEKVKRMNEYNS